jgi:hypothetical protein
MDSAPAFAEAYGGVVLVAAPALNDDLIVWLKVCALLAVW